MVKNEIRTSTYPRLFPNKILSDYKERCIFRKITNSPKNSTRKVQDEVEAHFGKGCNCEIFGRKLRTFASECIKSIF